MDIVIRMVLILAIAGISTYFIFRLISLMYRITFGNIDEPYYYFDCGCGEGNVEMIQPALIPAQLDKKTRVFYTIPGMYQYSRKCNNPLCKWSEVRGTHDV